MARRPARRKPVSPRAEFPWKTSALLLLASATAFQTYRWAERNIAPLLDKGAPGAASTRVYSAPRRIQAGSPLTPAELKRRLERLGYDRTENTPEAEGTYRETEEGFELRLRRFDHPFTTLPTAGAEGARLRLQDGRVASISALDGDADLPEIIVEPELLYEVSGPKRVRREPLASSDIPPAMLEALVSVEDRRFFEHPGVDVRGIARAALKNVRAGRIAEGGSTITQQLARNLYLSPKRTLKRKVSEALIALYLERRFSKSEILRMYLDNAYFGQDGPVSIVGLPAAARHFFGKEPGALSVSECALLAGLLKSPNGYSPFHHPDKAAARRAVVLAAMKDNGFLTEREVEEARAQEPRLRPRSAAPLDSDYFFGYLQRLLAERYEDAALLTRGLIIHTTLDPWLQERAQASVRAAGRQSALVALDPRSGAVRALVGGRDFSESQFDRATQAMRQPGSAFKPFVYGAALAVQRGTSRAYSPSTLLEDAARTYRIEGGTWTPRNYDRVYRGAVPLREALALSLNAATVALAAEVGPEKIIDYARDLGIRSPMSPVLGLALGIHEVTLLELTSAYCPFANGGYRVAPYGIEVALDAEGGVVEFHSPEPVQVLSPGEAYLMTDLLRGAVAAGTARSLARWSLAETSAGKTGTTDDGKDAWFIGYTPELLAGVWTGSDLPARLGLTGAGAALPIWARFIRGAGVSPPAIDSAERLWPRPEDVRFADIDPASGLLARSGCPVRRAEVFLLGAEPSAYCPLHSGGVVGWLKRVFRGD